MFDLLARRKDQGLDLLGGIGRSLGQGSHLGCHDREAATRIARSCRLDTRVEGQQIGLEGNLVDDPDDLSDLVR